MSSGARCHCAQNPEVAHHEDDVAHGGVSNRQPNGCGTASRRLALRRGCASEWRGVRQLCFAWRSPHSCPMSSVRAVCRWPTRRFLLQPRNSHIRAETDVEILALHCCYIEDLLYADTVGKIRAQYEAMLEVPVAWARLVLPTSLCVHRVHVGSQPLVLLLVCLPARLTEEARARASEAAGAEDPHE